jgi:pilus assembly protein Flp/PilA
MWAEGGSLRRFLKSEDGATAIEYSLVAALVAVAIIGAVIGFGGGLGGLFNRVSSRSATALTGL